MDNTMNIKLGSENNHMDSLSFHWNAIFKDSIHIFQFDKDGTEHKFKEVQDKFNDLVYFNLTNNNGKMFSINLTNGLIGYNRLEFPYIETEAKKENIRLIFFRRHRVEIGTEDLKENKHEIIYFLGFQYNTEDNKNHKILLQIDSEGNFIVTGD
jgi:hypothetical protein